MRLSKQQKKILEVLKANPNSTIMQIGEIVRGNKIMPRTSEYNSIARSLYELDNLGLVQRESSYVKWRLKTDSP